MKEYICVQVDHHKEIGKVIEEYQKKGWHLHTYQATGQATLVNHYLLFEREVRKKPSSVEVAAATAAATAAAA